MFRSLPARALALLLLLLAALLASAPAHVLSWLVPAGQVSMRGFEGTLWRGSASRVLVRTEAGYLHLGAVRWRLHPLSLLLFTPRLQIESSWGRQSLAAELALQGIEDFELRNVEANIPADLLRQLVPITLGGLFALQIEELDVRESLPVRAAGRLVWSDGRWDAPDGPLALGSYALDFNQTEAGAPLAGSVLTLAGPVSAEGSVQLLGTVYAVDVRVRSEGGLDSRLQQALSLIARPLEGGYHIKLEGEL